MFDVEFNEFIVNTVLSYQEVGYKDYIAYSTLVKTDIESFYEYHLIISKDNIVYSDNHFDFNGSYATLINFVGSEHKQVSYEQKFDKFTIADCLSITSNARGFVGTNTLQLLEYNSVVNKFDYSYSIATNIILCVILLYIWLRNWFAKNRNDVYE